MPRSETIILSRNEVINRIAAKIAETMKLDDIKETIVSGRLGLFEYTNNELAEEFEELYQQSVTIL